MIAKRSNAGATMIPKITYPIRRSPDGREYMQVGDRALYPSYSKRKMAVTPNVFDWPIIGETRSLENWAGGYGILYYLEAL
jgi:hypothetical protein